jgi:hypothetical protein
MWAATAWDDSDWNGHRARGWTVMGQLRKHRDRHLEEARAARRRLKERPLSRQMMSAAATPTTVADEAAARWTGGPSVLALLFAHPDTESIAALDARGEYFDQRTGDVWDLFFPGYYRARDPASERRYGARPVGGEFLEDWYFHPGDFDRFRAEIERLSERRWQYSGTTDLVLASAWLDSDSEPTVDLATTVDQGRRRSRFVRRSRRDDQCDRGDRRGARDEGARRLILRRCRPRRQIGTLKNPRRAIRDHCIVAQCRWDGEVCGEVFAWRCCASG